MVLTVHNELDYYFIIRYEIHRKANIENLLNRFSVFGIN